MDGQPKKKKECRMRKLFKSRVDEEPFLGSSSQGQEQTPNENLLFQNMLCVKTGVNSWKNAHVAVDKACNLICTVDAKNQKKYAMEGVDFCECYEFEKKRFVLKIIYTTKRIVFLSCKTMQEFYSLKNALATIGANELEVAITRLPIEQKPIKKWTHEDVMDYLSLVKIVTRENVFVTLKEVLGTAFEQKKINGDSLQQIKLQDMKTLVDPDHFNLYRSAFVHIRSLQRSEMCNMDKFRVLEKLERIAIHEKEMNFDRLEEIAGDLCDPELIKKNYFNLGCTASDTVKEEVENEEGTSIVNHDTLDAQPETRIRVKLIICELSPLKQVQNLRRFISPIVSKIPVLGGQYGIFHTALMVGPFYLEWSNMGLCVPKKAYGSMSLVCADVDTITPLKMNSDEAFKKLSHLIAHWNSHYNYRLTSLTGKKALEGNCQDFVDTVFQVLDIKPSFTGSFKEFLRNMKEKGTCQPVFHPPADLKAECGLTKDAYTFATHQELDELVSHIISKCSTFSVSYPIEYQLLKSFDRAFWIRHFNAGERDPTFQPCMHYDETNTRQHKCPFNDPRVTSSLAR